MSEYAKLIRRFILVLPVGGAFGWLLSRAWVPGSPAYNLLVQMTALFQPLGFGTPGEMLPSLLLGVWFGLVTAFSFDWRKHVHGILLLSGSLLAVAVIWAKGWLIANIDVTAVANLGMMGVGFLMGLAGDYGTVETGLRTYLEHNEGQYREESDWAILGIVLFSGILAAASLIQVALLGELTLFDPLIVAGYIYAITTFLTYNVESNTQIIGPNQSGKTYILFGLHRAFDADTEISLSESPELTDMLKTIGNKQHGDHFELPSTDELTNFWFHYNTGDLFPIRVRFHAYDHRGEHLRQLEESARKSPGIGARLNRFNLQMKDKLASRFDIYNLTETKMADLVKHRICTASNLVVVVDVARILNPVDSPQYPLLKRVAERVNENGGDVIIAVSKTDMLLREAVQGNVDSIDLGAIPELPEFKRNSEWQSGGVTDGGVTMGGVDETDQVFSSSDRHQRFADEVTGYLKQENKVQFPNLLEISSCDHVYPVFYRTVIDGADVRPLLDDGGNLQPVGFEYLAEELEYES